MKRDGNNVGLLTKWQLTSGSSKDVAFSICNGILHFIRLVRPFATAHKDKWVGEQKRGEE